MGLPDDEQLEWAAAQGRCVVTRNAADFLAETVQFLANGRPHRGVLILTRSLPNTNPTGIARALAAYAQAYPDGLPDYHTDYLHPALPEAR